MSTRTFLIGNCSCLSTLVVLVASSFVVADDNLIRVESPELRETSGLVASRMNPDLLWLHNDGPSNRLVGVRRTGGTAAIVKLNAPVIDLEDIALGPGTRPGEDYLYLGDIGDNDQRRPEVRVYRFLEPKVSDSRVSMQSATDVLAIHLEYPAKKFDAETLLVDPLKGDLFIITKERQRARVFVASARELTSERTVRLTQALILNQVNVSSGDISRDGKWILLRSEKKGWLWPRDKQVAVIQALAEVFPRELPVRRPAQAANGEAIGFNPEGTGYFTISEGARQPMAFFPLRPQ